MTDTTKPAVPEWMRKVSLEILLAEARTQGGISASEGGRFIAEAYAPEAARLRLELLALADRLPHTDCPHPAPPDFPYLCHRCRLRALVERELPEQKEPVDD